jgi:hypothetical protein
MAHLPRPPRSDLKEEANGGLGYVGDVLKVHLDQVAVPVELDRRELAHLPEVGLAIRVEHGRDLPDLARGVRQPPSGSAAPVKNTRCW